MDTLYPLLTVKKEHQKKLKLQHLLAKLCHKTVNKLRWGYLYQYISQTCVNLNFDIFCICDRDGKHQSGTAQDVGFSTIHQFLRMQWDTLLKFCSLFNHFYSSHKMHQNIIKHMFHHICFIFNHKFSACIAYVACDVNHVSSQPPLLPVLWASLKNLPMIHVNDWYFTW